MQVHTDFLQRAGDQEPESLQGDTDSLAWREEEAAAGTTLTQIGLISDSLEAMPRNDLTAFFSLPGIPSKPVL